MELREIKSTIINGCGYNDYFEHQNEIIDKISETDKNIIIQAPTSSGKTLAIAPFIYNEYQKNRKIIYSVPSKAMIRDKINELYDYFNDFERKPIIKKVGGDDAWKYANIIIGTFEEIYTGALNQNLLTQYNNIIFDDFHVLYDRGRGYTLEKLITFILSNLEMRIISLSATIGPLNHLSKWLNNARIFKFDDSVRPISLEFVTFELNEVNDLLKIVEKPILIFCATKPNTVSRANNLRKIMIKNPSKYNRNDRIGIIKNHKKDKADFEFDDLELLDLIEYRIAYHNANLDWKTKIWIEESFKDGKIDYLFTTTTLAYGINLPAKTVVIYDITRWNGAFNEDIPKYLWEQMVGRAGRTGHQEEGYAYTCYNSAKGKEQIEDKYMNGPIEDVKSLINEDDYYKKALLDIVGIGKGTAKNILNFFSKSLFMVDAEDGIFGMKFNLEESIQKQIKALEEMNYIELREPSSIVLTDFGKITVGFLQDTFDDYNLKALRSIRDRLKNFEKITPEEVMRETIVHSGLSEKDNSPIWLTPSDKDLEHLTDIIPGEKFTKAIATYYVTLEGWIQNKTIEAIEKSFNGKWAKYIKTINRKIATLLRFSNNLLNLSKTEVIGDLDKFIERVEFGVTENMLSFINIKGFGRITTIGVYKYFKSIYENLPIEFQKEFNNDILEAFKSLNNKKLVSYLSTIDNIGFRKAKKIFEAIGRDCNEINKKDFNKEERKHRENFTYT